MKLQSTLAIAIVSLATGCNDYGNDDMNGRDDDGMRSRSSDTNSDSTYRTSPSITDQEGNNPGSMENRSGTSSSTSNRNSTDRTGSTMGGTSGTVSGGETGSSRNNPPRKSGTADASSTVGGTTAGSNTGSTGSSTGSGASGSTAQLSSVDRTFVNDAASGGMFEVQSSQMALNQIEDTELKQAAQMIVDGHTQANNELKQIAQRKGVTIPTTLQPKHQQMLTQLRDAQGAELETQFRTTQVQAHQDAIRMFEQYSQNGNDAELKAFAQRCLPKLRTHLQELQSGSGGMGGMGGSEPR